MKRSLEVNGYYKLGREFGIEVKDLNDDEIVMKRVNLKPESVKHYVLAEVSLERGML